MAGQKDTLIIRHLPRELSSEDQEDFLKHFGATRVRCMGEKGRMKYTAFATFHDEVAATSALKRLHQLEFLNTKLVAEFSKQQFRKYHPAIGDHEPPKKEEDEAALAKAREKEEMMRQRTRDRKAISEHVNSLSSTWGFEYPMNPRLQYIYPTPTVSILTNIANALATVPKFYVQVLHLMNKMNIPAPFGPMTPTPPLPAGKPIVQPEPVETQVAQETSSEESELESEEESETTQTSKPAAPVKRPRKEPSKARKRPKLQQMIAQPQPLNKARPVVQNAEEVFDQSQVSAPKKIEFKLSTAIAEVMTTAAVAENQLVSAAQAAPATADILNMAEQQAEEGGFGKMEPTAKPEEESDKEEEEEEEWGATEFISSRKLRRGRISTSEKRSLNVFRNYSEGEPTTRVYIKNLSKQVTDKDLHYVFGKYVDWGNEQQKLMFDIRLMKEGRMKGQAFVTFPSEEQAKDAVWDTNGFVMHGKPMVVQFARSAKPKDSTTNDKK